MRELLAVLALLAVAAACAREGHRIDTTPARTVGVPGPDTVSGIVRRVGSIPFVRTLVGEGEEAVAVVGEYEGEVGRLTGAEVRVTGEARTGGLGAELRATSYEILSVDGERPHVGVLARDAEGYRLEGPEGASLALRAVPESYAQLVGARLWVVTDDDGVVIRYGVLRGPEESGPS